MTLEFADLKPAKSETNGLDGGVILAQANAPVEFGRQQKGSAPEAKAEPGLAHTALSMAGEAALFLGANVVLSRVPVVGRYAPQIVAGVFGFSQPVGPDQGLGTRLLDAGLAAGTVSLLGPGKGLVGAATSKLEGTSLQFLNSSFAKSSITNAIAGGAFTELDSLIHTGQNASAAQLGIGAASFWGMGAAFDGAGKLLDYKLNGTRYSNGWTDRMYREDQQWRDTLARTRNERYAAMQPELPPTKASVSPERPAEAKVEAASTAVAAPKRMVHVSESPDLVLRDKDPGDSTKPGGLWYSPNHEWARHDVFSMPENAAGYAYRVDTSAANILKLSSGDELAAFRQKYSLPGDGKPQIDWRSVAKDYDGVEFANVGNNERSQPDWYKELWVNSGSIWNATKLKLTPLGPMPPLEYQGRNLVADSTDIILEGIDPWQKEAFEQAYAKRLEAQLAGII